MSDIQPMHDAPVCPECEGPCMQPAVYGDGPLRPSEIATYKRIPVSDWYKLICEACGYEEDAERAPIRLWQAWYAVGAYEQRRHEETA